MTRATQVAQAASALSKARAADGDLPNPAWTSFRIFEDNGGAYRWRLVSGDGATIAQSGSFTSYEEAEQAARIVRSSAGTAPFEQSASDTPPVDLAARRDRPSDDSDAERWLDEGGSFSSEAVARWPAQP
jgi:uncharacterized protein YegP (UPF0339 family)